MEMTSLRSDEIIRFEEVIKEYGNFFLGEYQGHLYKHIVDMAEKAIMEVVLRDTSGNQLRAARILGINRNTLRKKIKNLGINPGKFKRY